MAKEETRKGRKATGREQLADRRNVQSQTDCCGQKNKGRNGEGQVKPL